MPKIVDKSVFYKAAAEYLGDDTTEITRQQVLEVCEKFELEYPTWLTNDTALRVGRGVYSLIPLAKKGKGKVKPAAIFTPAEAAPEMALSLVSNNPAPQNSLLPEKAAGYVPFGYFQDVRQIISSGKFYPIYITGLSGNGKTMMVEQVCAQEKREMIRVNVTAETDQDDLLGGFRLKNGATVWENGPVITAMERGAILLLDEVDLGTNKMMCLQPVLEGKGVYLKKINRLIHPAAGFNVMATANTKGKGSDDGRFIGTNVMNEAFLERFSITLEQEYASTKVETKILTNILKAVGFEDNDFVKNLVNWAEVVRKAFYDGAVSEIISTRRLVHIIEAYVIFGQNREKAIQLCLNRFDQDTKVSFMDLYKKLDEKASPNTPTFVATDEVAF